MKEDAWTIKEKRLLKKLWPTMGIKCAEYFPRRTGTAVKRYASLMGIGFGKNKGRPKKIEKKPEDNRERSIRMCYGYIPGGPVASIFQLAQRQA